MGTVFGDNCSDVIFVCVSLSGELGGGGSCFSGDNCSDVIFVCVTCRRICGWGLSLETTAVM